MTKNSSDILTIYYINKRQELDPTLNTNLTSDNLSLCYVNLRHGQKFSHSLYGPNSMARSKALINIRKYGAALYPLIDNSIDLQCFD